MLAKAGPPIAAFCAVSALLVLALCPGFTRYYWDTRLLAPSRASNSTWQTSTVIVPALWHEWDNGWPQWVFDNSSWAVFLYQRHDPAAPLYVPNFGYEGCIYLRFIVDHYDDLPNRTVFIQADLDPHGEWLDWVRCLPESTPFVQLPVGGFIPDRSVDFFKPFVPHPFLIEECWRDLLGAFGIELPPREEPTVAFTPRAAFIASRSQIRRHPLASYEAALSMICSPRCHSGPIDVDRLWFFAQQCPGGSTSSERCRQLAEEWRAVAEDPAREDINRNKDAAAMAFEYLLHVFIGGRPFHDVPAKMSCANGSHVAAFPVA